MGSSSALMRRTLFNTRHLTYGQGDSGLRGDAADADSYGYAGAGCYRGGHLRIDLHDAGHQTGRRAFVVKLAG